LTGSTGTSLFEVVPIRPAPGIRPGFNAAPAADERNVPLVDRSIGVELSASARPRPQILVFANDSHYFRAEASLRPGVNPFTGPLGGPAAQAALNQSVGPVFLLAADRANIPGAYEAPGNVGWVGNLGRDNAFNLLGRWRGRTRDPIMKFGLDPGTARLGGSVTWDLGFNRVLRRSDAAELSAFFKAVNVLDKRFETFVHHPMSGRTLSSGPLLSWSGRGAASSPDAPGQRHSRCGIRTEKAVSSTAPLSPPPAIPAPRRDYPLPKRWGIARLVARTRDDLRSAVETPSGG
jgi:hypothetical protein